MSFICHAATHRHGFTFEALDEANLVFDRSLIDEMINFQAEMRIEELDRSLGAGIGASKERHKLGLRIKAYAEFEAQLPSVSRLLRCVAKERNASDTNPATHSMKSVSAQFTVLRTGAK